MKNQACLWAKNFTYAIKRDKNDNNNENKIQQGKKYE